MHPTELKGFTEHLVEVYATLHDEVLRLRRENKNLHDELTKWRSTPAESRPNQQRPLKLGVDWLVDGDLLLSVSLACKLRFPSPICNVRISKSGQIAFSANKRIFLLKNNQFFAMEDSAIEMDPSSIRSDLVEHFRCIFDFDGELLITFWNGKLRCFSGSTCKWELALTGVNNIAINSGMIYLSTVDGSLLIIKDGICLKRIDYNRLIKHFIIIGNNLIGFTDCKVILIKLPNEDNQVKRVQHSVLELSEQSRIMSICGSGTDVYYGGELSGLRVCRMENGLTVRETIPLRQAVLAIGLWDGRLVSSSEKAINIWDLKSKKCMRIKTHDDVVDIAANSDTLCCVDNSGTLRVWKINKTRK